MNHVGIVGRITKDPELRYYNEKRPYSVFTLAINRSFKNTQGNIDADFIQCVAWGKLAETISKYCGKGSMIGVNGRLQSKSFLNQDNKKVNSIDVVAEDVRFYQLKSPTATTVDLDDFEPQEQQPLNNHYEQTEEKLQEGKSQEHSIVAETKESMTSEEEKELPIPS